MSGQVHSGQCCSEFFGPPKRRPLRCLTTCGAGHPQVTIKGKKCFGKTPITYIAVSYGYGKGAPVCADNKCASAAACKGLWRGVGAM